MEKVFIGKRLVFFTRCAFYTGIPANVLSVLWTSPIPIPPLPFYPRQVEDVSQPIQPVAQNFPFALYVSTQSMTGKGAIDVAGSIDRQSGIIF